MEATPSQPSGIAFYTTKRSSQFSQEPYPEPDDYIPRSPILFLKAHVNITPIST